MASVRERVPTDGSVRFAVLFRERATRKQTSHTYTSKVEAEQMAALILLPPSEIENVYSSGADAEYVELDSLVKVREQLRKDHGL